MLGQISKKIWVIVVIFVLPAIAACAGGEASQDIGPISSIEAQSASEAVEPTAVPTPVPTATATELPTEMMEPESPLQPASPVKEPTMATTSNEVQPLPGSDKALAAAITDLAQQRGVSPDEIRLGSMEAVEWSDASLGCPQEGYMYAQVITPGFLIILEAQGEQFEYHTDQAGNVVLCEP